MPKEEPPLSVNAIRYPDIQTKIRELFARNPNRVYDVSQLRKAFTRVSDSALSYHLASLRKAGVLESHKRGFYRLSAQAPPTVEEVRAAVAAQPSRVILSNQPFQFGKDNGVRPVDMLWQKLLKREVDSILTRMESMLPAKELFTASDREALLELLDLATQSRLSSSLPGTVERAPGG